jgi:hypothetical protein
MSADTMLSGRTPKLSKNQKLIDAIDEHGENWEFISKEIYNGEFSPEKLETFWRNLSRFFKPQKNKVFPFWTTKESLKLIDAVKACDEDWQRISIEWFDKKRSEYSLQKRWEKMFQIKRENIRDRANFLLKRKKLNETQDDILYSTEQALRQSQTSTRENPLKAQQKIMDKDQLSREFGRELNLQLSSIKNLFGQVSSVEIYFNSPDPSWTKEENSTLFATIKKSGTEDWEKVLKLLPGKSLKNIQERCSNILWETQEVEAFDKAFEQYDCDWSKISELVGTRSPGQCWSYWRITTGNDILESSSENRVKPSMLSLNYSNYIML